jgi:nitrogen PTS system EIIA component
MAPAATSSWGAMDIKSFLAPGDAVVDVRASDKTRLLTELCKRAAASLQLDADTVSGDILKREDLGSTGVGGGVAIPHARIGGLKAPFGILARLRKAIDFDAIDGQPVDIVFLLLLPTAPAGEQLNALASVARKLRDQKIVHDLRRASDSTSLYHAVISATA